MNYFRHKLQLVCLALALLSFSVYSGKKINIAFVINHLKESMLGSEILRGTMISEALKSNINCNNTEIIFSSASKKAAQTFNEYKRKVGDVHVCIIVKIRSPIVEKECKKSGAIVMVDIIDEDKLLAEITLLIARSPLAADITLGLNEVLLVQSNYEAKELLKLGRKAYPLPHQHTNPADCGLRQIDKSADKKLVVGHLSGSFSTALKSDLNVIMSGVCAAGAEFWNVEQKIGLIREGTVSAILSTVSVISCEGKKVVEVRSFNTTTNVSGDSHAQCAFYADEALKGIDIGLVWRAPYFRNPYIRLTTNNVFMHRPPTRLVHWMSRGVPVLFYPTFSYIGVTELHKYGHSVGFSFAVNDSVSIEKAIKKLIDAEVRVKMREEAILIAKEYSVDMTAKKLMKHILAEVSHNTVV